MVSLTLLISPMAVAQKVAVVDVQEVFDEYKKVKDARERLEKSKKIAQEELEIFRDELKKIVDELKLLEEKLKNPNIESSALKSKYQEMVKKAKEKQEKQEAAKKEDEAVIIRSQMKAMPIDATGPAAEKLKKD